MFDDDDFMPVYGPRPLLAGDKNRNYRSSSLVRVIDSKNVNAEVFSIEGSHFRAISEEGSTLGRSAFR